MENIDLHEIQRSILENLGYRNKLRFSELQGNRSSNKISFHLNKLKEKGLIEKEEQNYSTTADGKSYLAYLEQEGIRQPLIINHVFIFAENKIYLKKRDDPLDPFPGAYRGPVLRTEKNESNKRSAEEAFQKEFEKKSPKAEIRGVMRNNINFSEGFSQHYMAFFTVIEASEQAGSDFYDIDELDEINLIPGLEEIIMKASEKDAKFFGEWTIAEDKNGEFRLESLNFE